MDPIENPLSPGAGTQPHELVGQRFCMLFKVPLFDEFMIRTIPEFKR